MVGIKPVVQQMPGGKDVTQHTAAVKDVAQQVVEQARDGLEQTSVEILEVQQVQHAVGPTGIEQIAIAPARY